MRDVRYGIRVIAVMWLLSAANVGAADDVEQAVCGWFKERTVFALWNSAAGKPNPDAWRTVPGAERVVHKTRDGRELRGYRMAASEGARGTSGFVLFAQGNAMLADRLLSAFRGFAQSGVDVFVYDFRGYGESQGNRRLKAIVGDYQEILDALTRQYPSQPRYLYGISFGGIVLLNVVGRGATFDKAVIDSTPSRVSSFGCPQEYDPVKNLPQDCSNFMIISGARDRVVSMDAQAELRAAAEACGAKVVIAQEFAHPFMDRDTSVQRKRSELVMKALLGERTGGGSHGPE